MGKSKYIIQFGGLPVGKHSFEMEIKGSFFQELENAEIEDADIQAEVEVVKQNNVLTLNFHLEGTVTVPCDRCGEVRPMPVEHSESIVVKHGKPEESTDEIIVLPFGETEVDVSHFLYEFVIVSLPAKRIPCEESDVDCDYDTLKKLDEIETEEEKEDRSEEINPVWEKLKNIKLNEN